VRESTYAFYARDQWQVSRKLTVNYGVRYEFYPFATRDHFGGNRYDPGTNLAYLGGVNGVLAAGIPALIGPDLTQGSFPLPPNVGTLTFPKNFNRGYIESYNFTVQRQLGTGFNAQAGYVGTRTLRPVSEVNVNAAGPGGGNGGTPLFAKFGNANTISDQIPFKGGSYNSLQTRITRQMGASQVGAVYTFSKALDFFDNENNSLTWAWEPMWNRNKALAGYDRTHNFQFFAVYDLPFGHGKHWASRGVAAAVFGDWSLNSILSRTSGAPFTIASSGTSVNAPGNTQTADQVAPSVKILGGHGPNSPYRDPNAFAPVTAVRFGTSERDIIRGPGLFNLDASVYRNFRIKERFALQFRTEAYGLTNTPQFANPAATVSNATFTGGVVTNYNGYDIISSSAGDRQIRFALKFTY
jgi:TonB dependent receptor